VSRGSALTRLTPDGCVIIIGSRWHEDDLIGRVTDPARVRILEDAGATGAKFEVLNLEAHCEHPDQDPLHRQLGESLWPERWSKEKLLEIKATIGSREFAGQYQGHLSASDREQGRSGSAMAGESGRGKVLRGAGIMESRFHR